MKIDLSLNNAHLYAGCEIEMVAGRANLKTPVKDAIDLVGENIAALVNIRRCEQADDGTLLPGRMDKVTLTGPMAVWAYLIVFHAVVHSFGRVYYDDGRNGEVLIAAHG